MEDVLRQRRKRGLRLGLLLLICLLALVGVYLLRDIFAPLIAGFLIAYVLDPLADWLERLRFSRLGAVVVIFATLVGVATLFFLTATYYVTKGAVAGYYALVGDEVLDEVALEELADDAAPEAGVHYSDRNRNGIYDPGYIRRFKTKLSDTLPDTWQVAANERLTAFLDELKEDPEEVGKRVKTWLGTLFPRPTLSPGAEDQEQPSAGGGLFRFVGWFVFCPLYVFFFLIQIDPMIASIRSHLPARYRGRIERIFGKIDHTLASFFRGRLMVCVIKGALTSVGLLILGVPFWFPIGLAAGFLGLLPYVGIWLAIIPALLLTWVEHESLGRMLGVAVVFGAMESIEGFFLVPTFLGKEVGLHPVTIIVTLLIFGRMFGVIGVLLSVPLAAIAKILGEEFILPLVREFAEEDPEPPPDPPPEAAS